MRSVERVVGVSINTVTKTMVDAGRACSAYQDEAFRNLSSKRVQVDEIWAFTYAKQKNVKDAAAAPEGAGDTWTWTAIDADTKLVMSWLIGDRSAALTRRRRIRFQTETLPEISSCKIQIAISALTICQDAS